jgi:type IV pilus assembly protein PilC
MKKIHYQWSGIDLQGNKIHGSCETFNRKAAKDSLQQQGIAYLKLRKIRNYFLKKKISFSDTVVFYRQLATLITAGIPLTRALAILLKNHTHPVLGPLIQSLKTEIENGNSLSTAMLKHPRVFENMICHLIQIGEFSGTLHNMLLRIAAHNEKTFHLKNKIRQALFYPLIITVVAIVVALTLLLFVVPQFAELFQSFQSQLPYFTRVVVHVSDFLCRHYGVMIVTIIFIALFFHSYKKSPLLKQMTDNLLLKSPARNLIKKFILARFTRTLATTFAAGTPVNDALRMLMEMQTNTIFKMAIRQLQTAINSGQQLHKAMQNTGVFPNLMIQMVQVGEESGTLEQMLEKIAAFYEGEIDYWVTNFSLLLEPLIIIILGVLIGGLVIALYLPIFKLGTIL